MTAVPGQAFICLFAGITGQPFTSGRHLFLADTFSPPDLLFTAGKSRKAVRFSLLSRCCDFFLPGLFIAVWADCVIFIPGNLFFSFGSRAVDLDSTPYDRKRRLHRISYKSLLIFRKITHPDVGKVVVIL